MLVFAQHCTLAGRLPPVRLIEDRGEDSDDFVEVVDPPAEFVQPRWDWRRQKWIDDGRTWCESCEDYACNCDCDVGD